MFIVKYTRSDFNSMWWTYCHIVPEDKIPVPNRTGRNGLDFDEWLKQFPIVEEPSTKPSKIEDRGNEWTSHNLQIWEV